MCLCRFLAARDQNVSILQNVCFQFVKKKKKTINNSKKKNGAEFGGINMTGVD